MALQINSPYIRVEDANGLPYVGALLYIYLPETTTLASVFTDEDLQSAAANPATSNAKGEFPRIYIAAGTYKLRAEQKPIAPATSGTLIFEEDNIDTGLSAGTGALPISRGGTGATTAAAARANLDVPSNSELSDLADDIASLQSSVQNIVSSPQGRLTLTSGSPVISADVIAGTAIYYVPTNGNLVPIYNGTGFSASIFSELTLTLNSNHVANNIYDVFVFNDAGTLRLGTGPAWNTATAGSGARGSGAGTTEITRSVGGIMTNANAMTVRNGATTYSVAVNQGTYLGSIAIDGTNGQVTQHVSWGQNRKNGVWNAYNRVPILLKAGDSTTSWTYSSTTVRPSNNSTSNKITTLCGLAEEAMSLRNRQTYSIIGVAASTVEGGIGVGVNSTTAFSSAGRYYFSNGNGSNVAQGGTLPSEYLMAAAIGKQEITSLEVGNTGLATTFYGSELLHQLTAELRG